MTVVLKPYWWDYRASLLQRLTGRVFRLEEYNTYPAMISATSARTGNIYYGGDHCNHVSPVKTYFLVPLDAKVVKVTDKPYKCPVFGSGTSIDFYEGKYTGDWLDYVHSVGFPREGIPHGKGKFEVPNKFWYNGRFKNGIFNGKGSYSNNKSGLWKSIYVGKFLNGRMNGKGSLTMQKHRGIDIQTKKYRGTWKNGERIGKFKVYHIINGKTTITTEFYNGNGVEKTGSSERRGRVVRDGRIISFIDPDFSKYEGEREIILNMKLRSEHDPHGVLRKQTDLLRVLHRGCPDHEIHYHEFGSLDEFNKILKKYPNKVAYLIILTHGSPTTIQTGRYSYNSDAFSWPMAGALTPFASIVLTACLTGQIEDSQLYQHNQVYTLPPGDHNNFAASLALKTNRKVWATPNSQTVGELTVEASNTEHGTACEPGRIEYTFRSEKQAMFLFDPRI